MILLSNAGSCISTGNVASDRMYVGTVDGVACLERADALWTSKKNSLAGVFVSALAATQNGTLFAATHGAGVARSKDGSETWDWPTKGLDHLDVWAIRAGVLGDQEVIVAGTLPAHVYISRDGGDSWSELKGLQDAASREQWCFPPAPRVGHIKDLVIDGGRLFVGIEIGALLVSEDEGRTFRDMKINPDPRECDVHRLVLHPAKPDRMIVTNGLLGLMLSENRGSSWSMLPLPPESNYPDAIAVHPNDPDLMFLSVGVGWPPHWYKLGRARGKIARSRDGGKTWERLLGGLPDGQRALFSAISIDAWKGGTAIFAVDTDGQVFQSLDGGDHWTIIADVAPVSKGEFYRGLAKNRPPLAIVDDLKFNEHASERLGKAKV